MDIQTFFTLAPYDMDQKEKERLSIPLFNDLVSYHHQHCPEYAHIIRTLYQGRCNYLSLTEIPFLPINIFKELRLTSIPDHEIFKILLSSGTTGSVPSQIILDTATAHRQTAALSKIMQTYLGAKRLPMLIIDSPNVLKDPKRFSARGAGIVGMSHFGRDHFYALDDNMQINKNGLKRWIEEHNDDEFFIFGFTSILWQYFLIHTQPNEFNFSKAILFHSGGWKKLKDISLDNATFKTHLLNHFGLRRCHSFYGMVEQVGSIFVECEKGHLHCPSFADIIIRDPITWKPTPINQTGVVQVLSLLPTSYPGHSLLTEDLGCMMGIDTCPCGRKGKFFWIEGRVPSAEPRGCGDTFAIQKTRT